MQERRITASKTDIRVAIDWQIKLISELADLVAAEEDECSERLPSKLIDRMSVVLAVLYRCYESAPN